MIEKELKALETFDYIMTRCIDEDSYIIKFPLGVEKGTTFGEEMENAYKILQQALKRLYEIEDAKPSKALECLEKIDNTLCLNNIKGKLEFGIDTEEHTDCDSVIGMTEDLETIKQYILKAQEQEKVLSIIKEKDVDITLLKRSSDWLDYYTRFKHRTGKNTELTEQEFELLKRCLKNE